MVEGSEIGKGALIYHPELVNIYGCKVGEYVTIGPFVEIQRGVEIGECSKISSHSFLCSYVKIGRHVFVGHGVMFTNDLYPCIGEAACLRGTVVGDWVSIGSGATLLPVAGGAGAMVGAGAVVTRDVSAWSIVAGNPAKEIRTFSGKVERDEWLRWKAARHCECVPG